MGQEKRTPHLITIHESAEGVRLERAGAPLRTPKGNPIIVPTRSLALMLAKETFPPHSPKDTLSLAFQLTLTTLDHEPVSHENSCLWLCEDLDTDYLLCRHTYPRELRVQQDLTLNPYIALFQSAYAIQFTIFEELRASSISKETRDAILSLLSTFSPFVVMGLRNLKDLSGSLLLALLLKDGYIKPVSLNHAITLEARFQQKLWGENENSLTESGDLTAELEAYASWFHLLETPSVSGGGLKT